MSRRFLFLSIATAAVLAATSTAPVRAHTYDKLTYLSFNTSIQIPGTTLTPGTYRFHLADPSSGRNVVQVLSHDGGVVYAMFHTIPDARENVTENSTVTFREAPVGVAPPVKSLFYGGETRGYEFIYPRGGPNMIPTVTPQPPVTYAPIAGEAAVVAEAAPVEPAPLVAEPVAPPVAAPPEPVELPATASPLPLVGFAGAASLMLGLALTLFLRHDA